MCIFLLLSPAFFFEQVVFFVYSFYVLVPFLSALHSTSVFYISFLPFYFSRYHGCKYPSAVRVPFSAIERFFFFCYSCIALIYAMNPQTNTTVMIQ